MCGAICVSHSGRMAVTPCISNQPLSPCGSVCVEECVCQNDNQQDDRQDDQLRRWRRHDEGGARTRCRWVLGSTRGGKCEQDGILATMLGPCQP